MNVVSHCIETCVRLFFSQFYSKQLAYSIVKLLDLVGHLFD